MDVRGALLTYAVLYLSRMCFVGGNQRRTETSATITPFIEPREISDLEDVFTRGNKEYVFINYPIDYLAASALCNMSYGGRLALVTTVDLAKFLAEALSETNLYMDVLWIGAELTNKTWYWYDGFAQVGPVAQEIVDLFVDYSTSVPSKERKCLSFGRKDHDVPHFPALKCTIRRAFMCERDAHGGRNGSTHPGWIKIGKRLYKIFQEQISWVNARAQCIMNDRNSRLAVLVNYFDSQQLGRYLLIGRPSLENAWIGAKYYDRYYGFEQENIILSNVSDVHGYPPWRNGTVRKIGGCLLLDRHLANITLFVEARCDRLRSYICYKMDTGREDHFSDILIDEFGYRIYYDEYTWDRARDKCNTYREKYQAKLAEVRERRIVSHLIYVMGENKTAFQHIWLGGVLDPKINRWCWDSDQTLVNTSILEWLRNTTYFDNAEFCNTCLNMDRENHLRAMHYGAYCDFPQSFVCMFPRDKLIQLEIDEARNNTRRSLRKIEKRPKKLV